MKKQILMLSAFVFLFVACENKQEVKESPKASNIVFTEEEVKSSENNSDIGAQILVRKAILKEMDEEKYTPEEKKELEEIKKNVEIDYFLNKKAMETTNVDDMEVLEVYQHNIEKLKDGDITLILPKLKEQMILQRREEEKIKYMNSLVEKYNLNEELRKHFSEEGKNIKENISKEENKEIENIKTLEENEKIEDKEINIEKENKNEVSKEDVKVLEEEKKEIEK